MTTLLYIIIAHFVPVVIWGISLLWRYGFTKELLDAYYYDCADLNDQGIDIAHNCWYRPYRVAYGFEINLRGNNSFSIGYSFLVWHFDIYIRYKTREGLILDDEEDFL